MSFLTKVSNKSIYNIIKLLFPHIVMTANVKTGFVNPICDRKLALGNAKCFLVVLLIDKWHQVSRFYAALLKVVNQRAFATDPFLQHEREHHKSMASIRR